MVQVTSTATVTSWEGARFWDGFIKTFPPRSNSEENEEIPENFRSKEHRLEVSQLTDWPEFG